VDDEGGSDHYPGFCRISVRVPEPDVDRLFLELLSAPHNEDVAAWVRRRNGKFETFNDGAAISVWLRADDYRLIKRLANYIRRVIGKKARYPNPNWRWVAGRAAASLDHLATHLEEYVSLPRRRPAPRAVEPRVTAPAEDDLFAVIAEMNAQ